MKKITLITSVVCLLTNTVSAYQWDRCIDYFGQNCPQINDYYTINNTPPENCKTYEIKCWPWYDTEADEDFLGGAVYTCTDCFEGYTMVDIDWHDNYCSYDYDYAICAKACDSTCVSSSWTATGVTGYQKRVNRQCDSYCKETAEFRCAAGYWGTSSNGTSGCSPCPTPGTSDAGATAITQCYIPAGTTGSDSTGRYKYIDKCYYAN